MRSPHGDVALLCNAAPLKTEWGCMENRTILRTSAHLPVSSAFWFDSRVPGGIVQYNRIRKTGSPLSRVTLSDRVDS